MATNPLSRGLQPISRQMRFDILREKQPITPAMAPRFGKLGNGPDLWIDLQRAYDLHGAEKQLVKVLAKIPTLTAA
jgi:plasmid maintenance system antidote protein VapI